MDVLIVEDDAAVRTTFARALQHAGYATHEAATVAEAVRLLGAQTVDAIVCDFTLPGMDGSMLHQRLVEVAPAVADRIIFVTGWARDPKTRSLLDYTGQPLLEKPVEIADLLAQVRRITGR